MATAGFKQAFRPRREHHTAQVNAGAGAARAAQQSGFWICIQHHHRLVEPLFKTARDNSHNARVPVLTLDEQQRRVGLVLRFRCRQGLRVNSTLDGLAILVEALQAHRQRCRFLCIGGAQQTQRQIRDANPARRIQSRANRKARILHLRRAFDPGDASQRQQARVARLRPDFQPLAHQSAVQPG